MNKNKNKDKNKNKKLKKFKLKPIKPTRREINRYVMFQIIRGTNQEEKVVLKDMSMNLIKEEYNKEFIKKLKSTYINLFGIFDYAKAGIVSIKLNDKQEKTIRIIKTNKQKTKKNNELSLDVGIIKLRNDKLDELRTCFLFMDFLKDEQVIIRTLKTSGTIKSLIKERK